MVCRWYNGLRAETEAELCNDWTSGEKTLVAEPVSERAVDVMPEGDR